MRNYFEKKQERERKYYKILERECELLNIGARPSTLLLCSHNVSHHFNLQFIINIATEQDEGLYNFYFHACPLARDAIAGSNFLVCNRVI